MGRDPAGAELPTRSARRSRYTVCACRLKAVTSSAKGFRACWTSLCRQAPRLIPAVTGSEDAKASSAWTSHCRARALLTPSPISIP
eukprot:scaffold4318_cov300-Prasinococcus_capsulatus_cf.AAC.4